jgi:Protein of unknown function (DUF5672)
MKSLPILLIGVDCVELDRLIQSADICETYFEFDDVKLLSSLESNDNRFVNIEPIRSIEEYNTFTLHEMHKYVTSTHALIIQYDGFILNPDAWADEYLEYDYIGAPWWYDHGYTVGNGGFSLRSKKLMEIIATDMTLSQRVNEEPEDAYICCTIRKELEGRGVRFAPIELAKKFAFESNDKDGVEWTDQFGFHGLRWTDISKWTNGNPQYKIDNTLDDWATKLKASKKS